MMLDVPLGIIQRKVPSKVMFAVWNTLMIVAAVLFLILVRTTDGLGFSLNGNIIEITRDFLWTGVNFILLLFIGLLYGTIKEIYDVTSLSYLLNNNDPSEFDQALSKLNIYLGVGMICGILISILVLSLRTNAVEIILFVLIFLVICVRIYIRNYFDNSHEVFSLSTIKNLHITQKNKESTEHSTNYIKSTVSTIDFQKIKWTMDYIIMKPKEISKEFDWADIKEKTKLEFSMLYKLSIDKTSYIPFILWTIGWILIFGCWDTIVTTFFIDYLEEALKESGVQNIIRSGFILIGIIAIPAYTLQFFWIKKSTIHGKFAIVTLGFFISAISLFGLAVAGNFENLIGLIIVVLLGMCNSVGYAAGYPMSQSAFAEEYNTSYARITGSNVINADVSAAPLRILNNFANAIGLIFWGALISFVGFSGLFGVYGLAVLAWGILSIKKKTSWKLDQKG
jgi:MFS family permease